MGLLKRFSAELLIGQVSYNQRSDIYNYVHGYESKRKITTTLTGTHITDASKCEGNGHRYSFYFHNILLYIAGSTYCQSKFIIDWQ
jgi:hypothetical protein